MYPGIQGNHPMPLPLSHLKVLRPLLLRIFLRKIKRGSIWV